MDLIKSLQDNFKLTNEGDLVSFLRIKFNKISNFILELSQPYLIQRIIDMLDLIEESKQYDIPSNVILKRDTNSKPRKQS